MPFQQKKPISKNLNIDCEESKKHNFNRKLSILKSNYQNNNKTMNFTNVIVAICSLLFIMVGADKFLSFLEPPCSLMGSISPLVWNILGVLQISAGILIWLPKFRKYVAGFFAVFMIVFTIIHLTETTYDIGGSAFMAVLLGLIVWNPKFLRGKKN